MKCPAISRKKLFCAALPWLLGGVVSVVPIHAAAAQTRKKPQKVRDIIWAWGITGRENKGPRTYASFASATPLQGAALLGVPNIVMAGQGLPDEDAKADQFMKEVAGAPRLAWEISPDQPVTDTQKEFVYTQRLARIRRLVDKYPQIESVLLDDMSTIGIQHGFKPAHITQIRDQLPGKYKSVKLSGVVYSMNLNTPGINEYIRRLDEVSLWVWDAKDLGNIEEYVAHVEKLFPGKPISLGLYLFDYGSGKRMPLSLLDRQFETALKLAHQRRIESIVLLTINDDAEAVHRAADWVKRVGDQKLGSPPAVKISAKPALAPLKIGDGRDWSFVESSWSDGENGEIKGVKAEANEGLQGLCLAFQKTKSYSDFEAEFGLRLRSNHSDAGLVVRAQDPTHYYMVHFPQGGQSYRAQHYWVALSRADGSGYLRTVKMALVPRVPSNPLGVRNQVRIKVSGDRFQVWVNGNAALDVRDGTYRSGRIGLSGFEGFVFDSLKASGTEARAELWNDKVRQVKNWFTPFSGLAGTQGAANLSRTPDGELLCRFNAGDKAYLGRSKDGGHTWTTQDLPANVVGEIYLLDKIKGWAPDSRLASFDIGTGAGRWSESMDEGMTWTEPKPITTPEWPTGKLNLGTGWQLRLRDGTLIRFALGAFPAEKQLGGVTMWGAYHCNAYSIRSTDGGLSWSAPVSLDASSPEFTAPNNPMGNLDLTEPTAFETTDGRIVCLIRPIYSPWMWETWSTDKGKTWGPCVRGPFPGYAPTAIARTSSGTAVLPVRFPGLTLRTTRDDAATWDEGTYIDTSIWAMGSLCEVEPDLLLFIYMDSYGGPLRAQYIRVTPQGLQPVAPDARH